MVPHHHERNVRLIAALAVALAGTPMAHAAPDNLPQALTTQPGDPRRGIAVAVNSDRGNCIICHALPIAEVPAGAFGDLGPPLAGVGARLSAAELRQRIVDPKVMNPDTVMPAYYTRRPLHRVQAAYADRTILSSQDVEDLVSYLETLK